MTETEPPTPGEPPAPAPRPPRPARPPRPPQRRRWLPPLAGALLLAVVGFLIWYFAFRSDGGGDEPQEAGGVAFAPASLDFGDEDLGKRSAAQQVTLTNGDSAPLGIAEIVVEGQNPKDFVVTKATQCSTEAPLNEAEACTVGVRFRPRGRGPRVGTLVVRFNGGRGQSAVQLRGSGVGEPSVTAETTRLDFGSVEIATDPKAEKATITNVGNAPLVIESIAIEGADASDFGVAGGKKRCSPDRRVKAGATCTITVRFSPTELGERTATLVVAHDAQGSPTRFELQGAGTGRPKGDLSPNTVKFGQVRVGQRSKPKTVTFENTGTDTLTVGAIRLDGGNRRDFAIVSGGTCASDLTLEPGKSCTIEVRFRPHRTGQRQTTLEIEADTNAGVHTAELSGTGRRARAR